jgi:hypothetical protein
MRYGVLALLCAACTTSDPEPPGDAGGFEPDAMQDGARLWIEADERQLSLWAAGLGDVLGIAAHVKLDTTHVAPGPGTAHAVLGDDAITLLEEVAAGDLVIAMARRGAAAGDVAVDVPTELATVPYQALSAGDVRLEPSRVMVRRGDGSYVGTVALGGTLHIAEGDAP